MGEGRTTRGGPFTGAAGLRAWLRQWRSLLLAASAAVGLYALFGALSWWLPGALAGPEGPSEADRYAVAEVVYLQSGPTPSMPAQVGLRMEGVALVARAPEVIGEVRPGDRVRVTYQPTPGRLAGTYTVRRIEPLSRGGGDALR